MSRRFASRAELRETCSVRLRTSIFGFASGMVLASGGGEFVLPDIAWNTTLVFQSG
jgi:hypothetical protein